MIYQPEHFWYSIDTDEYYGTRLKLDYTGIASEAVYDYLYPLTQMSHCEDVISNMVMLVKNTLPKFGYVASEDFFKHPNLWILDGPILEAQLPTLLVVSKSMSKSVSLNRFDLKQEGNGSDEVNFSTFDSSKIYQEFLNCCKQNGIDLLFGRHHCLGIIQEDLVIDVSNCYLPKTLTLHFEYRQTVEISIHLHGSNSENFDYSSIGLFKRLETSRVSLVQANQILVQFREHLNTLGFEIIEKKTVNIGKGRLCYEIKYSFPQEMNKVDSFAFYLMKIKPMSHHSGIDISICPFLDYPMPDYNIFGSNITKGKIKDYSSYLDCDVWGDYDNIKAIIQELADRSKGIVILHLSEENELVVLVCSDAQVNRNSTLLTTPKFELLIDPTHFEDQSLIDLEFEGGSDFLDERVLIHSFAQKKVSLSTYYTDSNFRIVLDHRFHEVIPNYEFLLSALYDLGWEIRSIEGFGILKVIFGKVSDYLNSDFLPRKTFQELIEELSKLE
jgi:hypothetical protein